MAVIETEIPGDFNIQVYSVDMFGERFGSGPIEGATVSEITWANNLPGTAAFSFNPLAKNAKQVRLEEREIQIWFDDDLVWWGVPWRADGDLNTVNIGCDGLLSWFMHRFVDRMSLLYTSIDQLTIAWNLLTYAQNEAVDPHRDLNIDAAAFAPSGKVRSRNYERHKHDAIYDLLQEFPTLSDGFDFEIAIDNSGQRLWTPYYPRRGVTHNNLRLIVTEERQRSIESFQYAEDATIIANDVYVTGGTSGDVRFEAHVQDLPSMAQRKDMQAVISDGDQKDVNWLEERGEREIALRKEPQKIPTIGVPSSFFGIFNPGDSVPLFVDYGYYQVPNDLYRISQVQWTPAMINLTFEQKVAA